MKLLLFLPIRYKPNEPIYPGDEVILYLENLGHSVITISTQAKQSIIGIDTLFLRLIRYLEMLVLIWCSKPDIITVVQDVIDGYVCLWVCRMFDIRLVVKRANPLEQASEMGILSKLRIGKLYERLGYSLLKRADLVMGISKKHVELMIEKGIDQSKIMVVTPGVNITA